MRSCTWASFETFRFDKDKPIKVRVMIPVIYPDFSFFGLSLPKSNLRNSKIVLYYQTERQKKLITHMDNQLAKTTKTLKFLNSQETTNNRAED